MDDVEIVAAPAGAAEPDRTIAVALPVVSDTDYSAAVGESLAETLDIQSWTTGENLADLYPRLQQETEDATKQEARIREAMRKIVFPRLSGSVGAPRDAGVYKATVQDIERVHRGLLLTGAVEACDGSSVIYDTLPITIAQIGVCLVSYAGDQGSWVQHLYRKDLRVGGLDPVEEVMEMLERRQRRDTFDVTSQRDTINDLFRRGIMTYAERAVLLDKATAPWRMGHGNPAAYELITGSGSVALLKSSIEVLHRLIVDHKKFVFVPSAGDRKLLTIGNALYPLEYAIVASAKRQIEAVLGGNYRGEWAALKPRLQAFANEAGSQIVVGVYRASHLAPAQIFYAHADYAHEAALIAMADSLFQEHRGFPMLIDLADTVCSATFAGDSFATAARLAYVDAGEPFRYATERQTRQ